MRTLAVDSGGFQVGQVAESYYQLGQRVEGGFALEPSARTVPDLSIKPIPGSYLIEMRSGEVEYFEPMKVERLHRRFAKVELTDQGVLTFATKYGFLGRRTFLGRTLKQDNVRFEEVVFWLNQVIRMRLLISITDLVTDASQSIDADKRLLEMIDLDPRGGCGLLDTWLKSNPSFQSFALGYPNTTSQAMAIYNLGQEQRSRPTPKTWSDLPEEDRCRRQAMSLVVEHLNIELLHSVTAVYSGGNRPKLSLMPLNLLGAMYLHLARSLTADTLTNCEGCGKIIVGARLNQRFCDQVCRQRAHRRMKRVSAP